MKSRSLQGRYAPLALATFLCLGLSACEEELTDPGEHIVGSSAPEIRLDAADAGGVPSGALSLEGFRLIVDTVGQSDVFQRAGADGYYTPSASRYHMHNGGRIAGQDPRLPALAPLYAPEEFRADFARVMGPDYWGAPLWDFFMRWYGLEPAGTYTYSIERLATIVNGAPDAMEFLIDGEVTEPDELVPLNGSPGGYPDNDYSWTSSAGCQLEPIPDPPPNPWYLGPLAANTDGRITPDFCMGTPWLWYTGSTVVPDSSIVAPNELRLGVTPEYQYNYIVVYEGEPPNLGPPVIRVQMGVDLDTNGNPLPNGFAPFPVDADREAVLALPNVQAAPSRVRFEVRDLEPLAEGTPYQAWLVNGVTGASTPATGDYFTIETITVVDELGQQTRVDVPSADTIRTANFEGTENPDIRHVFVVRNRTIDPEALGDFTHVTLARPGSQGSLEAPAFWAQYLEQSGTPDDLSDDIFIPSDAFKLGAFDMANPPESRVFTVGGSGEGLIWQDELGMLFRSLIRPPSGYHYEVWLVDNEGAVLSMGGLTTPAPGFESLEDADTEVHPEFMTQTRILEAAKYAPIPDGYDLSTLAAVRLTLEPKAGIANIGPTLVLQGAVPEGFFE